MMARHESDREDLMREAVALVRRVELSLPGEADPVVAGFRAAGDVSVYFGQDPVFHFDAAGALRRAFVGGELYRSEGNTLAKLRRFRETQAIELQRHDLNDGELSAFLCSMTARVKALHAALAARQAVVVATFPEAADVAGELLAKLGELLAGKPKLAPRIVARR